MRAVRTSDIARLFFRNKRTAQKRMRRIFDAGFIRPIVIDLAAESRHVLTRLGHEILFERLGDDAPVFRPAPRIDARHFVHHDLVISYWVSLALGASRFKLSLKRFFPEWDLRSAYPDANLIPDALIVVERGDVSLSIALEVDTGTERPTIIASKLDRYDALDTLRQPLFGVQPDVVLFLTVKERRARRLAAQVANRSGIPVVFGIPPYILEDGGLSRGLAAPGAIVASPVNPFTAGFLTGIDT